MSKSKKLVIQKRVNRIVAAQKADKYVERHRDKGTGLYGTYSSWDIAKAYKAGFRAGKKEK